MIDPRLEEYIEKHTSEEPGLLHELSRKTFLNTPYPRMLSGHVQGRFLEMISRMVRPSRILEVGTFTGYSAICLAQGLEPGGKLYALEAEGAYAEIAREYITRAGLDDRIILHIGDAMKIIPTLNETWDLIYIDADKPNYLNYYKMLFDHLRPGGFLLADNALWGGNVIKPRHKLDKESLGIVEFNEFVKKDERVENVLLPVRDGIMMVRKKW